MANTYRSSLERHNAPYRGVTSREDDVNFNLAVLHDLTQIQRVSGGHPSFSGHRDQIQDNLSAIYHGEGTVTASAPTAGMLVTKTKTLPQSDPSGWSLTGGAVCNQKTGWRTWELKGTTHRSGLSKTVPLEPGDTLVLRAQISALQPIGATRFAWGARDFNGVEESLTFLDTADFLVGSGKKAGAYIEKRLRSEGRQEAEIVLYAVHGTEGTTTLLLTDLSLSLYAENPAGIAPMDPSLKRRLDGTGDQLAFLEDQILKQKGEWD